MCYHLVHKRSETANAAYRSTNSREISQAKAKGVRDRLIHGKAHW